MHACQIHFRSGVAAEQLARTRRSYQLVTALSGFVFVLSGVMAGLWLRLVELNASRNLLAVAAQGVLVGTLLGVSLIGWILYATYLRALPRQADDLALRADARGLELRGGGAHDLLLPWSAITQLSAGRTGLQIRTVERPQDVPGGLGLTPMDGYRGVHKLKQGQHPAAVWNNLDPQERSSLGPAVEHFSQGRLQLR